MSNEKLVKYLHDNNAIKFNFGLLDKIDDITAKTNGAAYSATLEYIINSIWMAEEQGKINCEIWEYKPVDSTYAVNTKFTRIDDDWYMDYFRVNFL